MKRRGGSGSQWRLTRRGDLPAVFRRVDGRRKVRGRGRPVGATLGSRVERRSGVGQTRLEGLVGGVHGEPLPVGGDRDERGTVTTTASYSTRRGKAAVGRDPAPAVRGGRGDAATARSSGRAAGVGTDWGVTRRAGWSDDRSGSVPVGQGGHSSLGAGDALELVCRFWDRWIVFVSDTRICNL
ncbi:uncharacterized protein M6B38_168920 [Iris pallida]|uniref:Uncharacterized protein n=1 Tax=Iris pallida TaxID=29817 RepID=A0AAX6EVA9_IRIPA|nr:uncharacterized protein M6B38_168920 [Iris pallida]